MQPYATEFNKLGNFFKTIVLSSKLTVDYGENDKKII